MENHLRRSKYLLWSEISIWFFVPGGQKSLRELLHRPHEGASRMKDLSKWDFFSSLMEPETFCSFLFLIGISEHFPCSFNVFLHFSGVFGEKNLHCIKYYSLNRIPMREDFPTTLKSMILLTWMWTRARWRFRSNTHTLGIKYFSGEAGQLWRRANGNIIEETVIRSYSFSGQTCPEGHFLPSLSLEI